MIIVLLIIEILIIGYIDYKIYGTYYTPAIILTVPFIVVVIFNLICGSSAGLYSLYLPSLWVWVLGLISFWIPGFLLSVIFIRKTNRIKNPFKEEFFLNKQLTSVFRILSLILIVIMYIKLLDSLAKFAFGTETLSKSLSGGPAAHASVILMIPVTYFLIISDAKKSSLVNWIIISLWLFFAFCYNSKTWILMPLIAGIFGKLAVINKNINFKKAILLLGLGVLIFYISYSLSFGYFASWNFVKNHFILYTNAGLLSYSEYLRLRNEVGISLEFLFEPIFNIFYKFTGNEMVSIISELNMKIGPQHYSNVKTFFGEIYIYGGLVGGLFTSFIWGASTYMFLILNVIFKDIFFFIMYLLIIAALFFGWFGIYFNNLSYYELIFASLSLVIITRFLFSKDNIVKS